MKIAGIEVFEYEVSYAYGPYAMSGGRVATSHTSLVVRVRTDEGLEGFAETCPHGRTYLPSFVEGERAALQVLSEALLGADPLNHGRLAMTMDDTLLGSNAAKGALDIACWDILGKATGLPVCDLLGGRRSDTFPLFVAVPIGPVESMAEHVERELAQGMTVFQVKVGDRPESDVARVRAVLEAAGPEATVIADANGGWNLTSALLAAQQLAGLPVRLEQPCATLTDCAELRKHTALPLIVDEAVTTVEDLAVAKLVVGASGVNVKPSRVGGLTRARAFRDTAEGLGMTFTVDDTWGGALVTAQIAALAASSHPANLTGATSFTEWVQPLVATGPRMSEPGRGRPLAAPGLGLDVDLAALGPAVVHV